MYKQAFLPFVLAAVCGLFSTADGADPRGADVRYTLPTTGLLPQTYRVTLAITDPKNPDWILSTFVAGAARTVTAENQGRFVERWDGLDDNFMPLPPGGYGVKGIYMPAAKWAVDGEYHSIVPQFAGGPSCWLPTPQQTRTPEPFGGDPCGAPLADLDVGPNGHAVFYWTYLENGSNQAMFDLHEPIGHAQFLRAFPSGGAGGGTCTCTDGTNVWSFSTDGGEKYVYRADGKPFGTGRANRPDVYLPQGWVRAMACYRNAATGKSYVYVAQGGRIEKTKEFPFYAESVADRVDKITIHNGDNGAILGEIAVHKPQGLVARHGTLAVLDQDAGGQWIVRAAVLQSDGNPQSALNKLFTVPAKIMPADLEVDVHQRFYLSDAATNHVYQVNSQGQITHTFGRLPKQQPGRFDTQSFIAPGKLATWTDEKGHDRLLVVEDGGPNRVTEWDADGTFIREFLTPQTRANDGWTVDPEHVEHVYVPGQQGWLTRFKVDYVAHRWTIDAVWPDVPDLRRPVLIRREGRTYLACKLTATVYRLDGDRWVKSAAIFRAVGDKPGQCTAWHDANGDGQMQDNEKIKLKLPAGMFRCHGGNWLGDLSYVAPAQGEGSVWKIAPAEFDVRGNPVFREGEVVLSDPVFQARKNGSATALFGANELAESYDSDWAQVDGSTAEGFYVNARGGRGFNANEGGQLKISRYVPDGKGGYKIKWRVGRAAIRGIAQAGEIYGSIHIYKPINGLLSVVDNSRCGVLLYTDSGLFVESVFLDGRRYSPDKYGIYPQPGEFFAGTVYPNPRNGKICLGMGKVSPQVFEAVGWSLAENPVRDLTELQRTVVLAASQIGRPPETAITLRGGAGSARLARFTPAIGGANLDTTLAGWESCDPVSFAADTERKVEARLLYDKDHIYVRWHARLAAALDPKVLDPANRLFTHDRLADTLSLYFQGDMDAAPSTGNDGRAGDVRIVFGVYKEATAVKPVALAMYAAAPVGVTPHPVRYKTPVSMVELGHVALLDTAKLNWKADADNRGFVLVAAIPRAAVTTVPELYGGLRTMVNFEATFAGHNKFWWSNADGSASRDTYDEPSEANLYPRSWSPAEFLGLDAGIVVRNWQLCGPFGGPGFEKLTGDPDGMLPGTRRDWKEVTRELCEAASYPPDRAVDLRAVYTGEQIQGYWDKLNEVRWRPATVEPQDVRVIGGQGGQVYYGATWIHVPGEMELAFKFQGHPQTPLRWFVNGQHIDVKLKDVPNAVRMEGVSTVKLKTGWNEVRFRAFCYGYPPLRAGLVIGGPEALLWRVRLSDHPPR